MPMPVPQHKNHQRGQAMTEYMIMGVCCLMVLLGAMTYFLDNFGDFYDNVIKVICLPIP